MIAPDKTRRTFCISKKTSEALTDTCKNLSISPSVFIDLALRYMLDTENENVKDPLIIGASFLTELAKSREK